MANQGNHLPLAPRPPKAPPQPENVPNDRPSKLVHLARTPAEIKQRNGPVAAMSDQPAYGYGLGLELGPDELDKLGVSEPPAAGTTMHATVQMHVRNSSSEVRADGKARPSVSLQVTHMKLHPSSTAPVVKRAPGSKPGASVPRGKVPVAAHLRRVPTAKPHASRGSFVRPPTVKRVR